MSEGVMIALISLSGTLIGTFTGIVTSSRLMSYRIEELEKKVQDLSKLIEKTYGLEKKASLNDEKMSFVEQRVTNLEKIIQIN